MQINDELKDKIRDITDMADGLLITAGAGMGIDSGLPDFRGEHGFWNAYPALKHSGIDFYEIASPDAFITNPNQAWGFYGHRLNLYRKTIPHAGFAILRNLAQQMPNGAFVFTSNVDGQFQKASFSESQIVECHGSIHHLQCINGCLSEITSAKDFQPVTDDTECLLLSPLPRCIYCGEVTRPNILMFNDWKWIAKRTESQKENFDEWLSKVTRLVIIEIGAGTSIPTVRKFSESQKGYLIRINPDEPELPSHVKGISLPMTGLAGLLWIAETIAA
jgi:NAD-dependent SIR2 family protein deacetylase